MEVSLELILGVGGLIVGVLGLLGKRKYAKMGEAVIRGVEEFVGKPKGGVYKDVPEYLDRKKVKEHIKTIAELLGVEKKLNRFKCRVEKKANKLLDKYLKNDR